MHDTHTKQALYLLVAAMALVTSYMVSAALILRQTEGLWRLPLGGGAWEALQRAAAGNGYYVQLNAVPQCTGSRDSI